MTFRLHTTVFWSACPVSLPPGQNKTSPCIQRQVKQSLTYSGSGLRSVQGADDDEAEAFILFAVNDHITGLQAVWGEAFRGRGTATGGSMVAVAVGCVVTAWRAVVGWHGAWTPPILWAGLPWNTHQTQALGCLTRVLISASSVPGIALDTSIFIKLVDWLVCP